jgi:uncharacterized protein (DUF1697 family)
MRYVALLRAVNVGGRIVKMDRLRAVFEQLPLKKVETFIASGNVLFDSTASASALELRIEKHLEKSLGYAVPAMLRSAAEIKVVAAHTPFPSLKAVPPQGALYVGFLKSPLEKSAAAKVIALADATSDFHVHGREVYWLARDRMAVLKDTGTKLQRAVAMPMTVRNVTTVRKLAHKIFHHEEHKEHEDC